MSATLVFDSHTILSQTKTRKSLHSSRVAVPISSGDFSVVKVNLSPGSPGENYTINTISNVIEITSNLPLDLELTKNGTTITTQMNRKFFLDASFDSVKVINTDGQNDASVTIVYS